MKRIPIALKNHLDTGATTWCYLMRVACVGQFSGRVYGFTSLDVDVTYDDGAGAIVYRAGDGFTPSKFQSEASFGVDNAEMTGWVTDSGITQQEILAGLFDSAEVSVYRINYSDPQPRSHEVVEYGAFGDAKIGRYSWRCEFRSLKQIAKQPYINLYSRTCRAQYGDAKCTLPLVWKNATVTTAGDNARITFQSTSLTESTGAWAPGVFEATSGANAGKQMDIDIYESDAMGGRVYLSMPLPFQMEVGDTFRVRLDCDKSFDTCKARANELNFRGEHLIPVEDSGLQVPGAHIKRAR